MTTEKYAGTQTIARAFALVNLFTDEQPVWSLPDLINASGLKRTTVFRLLSALEAEQIVRKTETGDYMLGPGLIALGGRAIRTNQLRAVAQPLLRELVQRTGESVTIDILWIDDEQRPTSMVIEEQLAQRVLGLSQYIGARFPAHTTSTGKVLLAYQSPKRLAQLQLTPLASYTEHTITTTEVLDETLAEIRKQGYATTINELELGLTAIAAPIFNHYGEVQAALCIGGSSSRFSSEKLVATSAVLIEYGQQISRKIGYL
ncbi:MAG: IclR family transcriptional regulator [Chloroflexota bacterium]